GRRVVAAGDQVLQDDLRQAQVHRLTVERGERRHADQRALQLTDVPRDARRDELQHLRRGVELFLHRLLAQDGDARLQLGRLDVRDQPPLETVPQPVLQRHQLLGRPVAGQHDLLVGVVQRVEGVEELLLRRLLVRQELDVVDQEDVHLAVALAEAVALAVADGVDELVGELLRADVPHARARVEAARVVPDRVQQVRLAEARLPIDEEGVVRLGRRLRDGDRGRVREPVGRADHERVEEVLRVEPRRRFPGTGGRRGLRRQRTGSAGGRQVRADRSAPVDVPGTGRRLGPLAAPGVTRVVVAPVVVAPVVVTAVVVGARRFVLGALRVVGGALHRLGAVVLRRRTPVTLLSPVPVLRGRRVGVTVGKTETLLLPAVLVLCRPLPGPRLGTLVLGRVGGAGGGELVAGGPGLLGTAAAVPRITVVGALVLLAGPLVLFALVALAVRARRRELGLLVAGLGAGPGSRGGGGRGLARGLVDGDGDPDGASALAAQALADDRCEAALEHTLRELVRHGEQRGVGDQGQRLAAPDPVLVLPLDPVTTALTEELFQNAWPHCGKIGRYVSHRARSLTGPSNV